MPDPISQTAQSAAGSVATALEGTVRDALGLRDAVDGARLEAERSGLPSVNLGGPGDAYRHLLVSGEMKRRFGPQFAEFFANAHEFVNDITGSQTERDRQMDSHNNLLAAGGPTHETWADVVAWARSKIAEAAAHDGAGRAGRAFWYSKQAPDWRPTFANLPITPIEKGGSEHRYDGDDDGSDVDEALGLATIEIDPLDRPVGGWNEDDIRAVLNSEAYLQPGHPRHLETQRDVRVWFERRFGTGPAPRDATGRATPSARSSTNKASACAVPVRAHSRRGGEVEVDAHCRTMPAA